MSKKNKRWEIQQRGFGTNPLDVALKKAEALVRRGHWQEAQAELEALEQQHPNHPEVVSLLAGVYYETGDLANCLLAWQRLSQLRPNSVEVLMTLAGICAVARFPVLALQRFQEFLDRWPDHADAAKAREAIAELEEVVQTVMTEVGLDREQSLAVGAMHEMAKVYLEAGKLGEGRQLAEQVLAQKPDFVPALNNLSLIQFLEGETDTAIVTAQRALDQSPDSVYALANLVRLYYQTGQLQEAEALAPRLKAIESDLPELLQKQAEALSYLGDDAGVLAIMARVEALVQQAQTLPAEEAPPISPMLYHYGAVAALRLNQVKQVKRYWEAALEIDLGFEWAQRNLEDLQRPVGQRQEGWAFPVSSWMSFQAAESILNLEGMSEIENDIKVQEAARQYIQQHPEIAALIPVLLDRGDPAGRQLALLLASIAKTPELLQVVKDFALSQRGPDEIRQRAAQVVSEAGLFPEKLVRMWLAGQWREVKLLGYQVHQEQLHTHSPKVEKLGQQAVAALKEGKPNQAEPLLKQALKAEPNAIDLRFNLASVYEYQGKFDEALKIIEEIYQENPDYTFGRIGLARSHLRNGELDQAGQLLEPLVTRQRFHYSELNAFCDIQIELLVAQCKLEEARSWLELWAVADSDSRGVHYWRARLHDEDPAKRIAAERKWKH